MDARGALVEGGGGCMIVKFRAASYEERVAHITKASHHFGTTLALDKRNRLK